MVGYISGTLSKVNHFECSLDYLWACLGNPKSQGLQGAWKICKRPLGWPELLNLLHLPPPPPLKTILNDC